MSINLENVSIGTKPARDYYREVIREELEQALNDPDESTALISYDRIVSRLAGMSAYAVLMSAALKTLEEAEDINLQAAGHYVYVMRKARQEKAVVDRRN